MGNKLQRGGSNLGSPAKPSSDMMPLISYLRFIGPFIKYFLNQGPDIGFKSFGPNFSNKSKWEPQYIVFPHMFLSSFLDDDDVTDLQ